MPPPFDPAAALSCAPFICSSTACAADDAVASVLTVSVVFLLLFALAAVEKMSSLLEAPENVSLLEKAKETAGQDVMQYMMVVLPTACQILTPCLSEFGFSADQAGAMGLIQALEKYKDDPEISSKAKALKAKFIPDSLAPMLGSMMGMGQG